MTLVEALPDPPLLSVTVAVTVTCLDCGRLRSRVEGDRAGVELSVGAGAGNRALGRGPAIGQRAAAIGTRAVGAHHGHLSAIELRGIGGHAAHRRPAVGVDVDR